VSIMKAHFHVLDGLRGTAALSVIIFHVWELLVPSLEQNPMPHTFLAVDFFFALSGFVLGHAYDARLSPQADAGIRLSKSGYFVRRLIRLHPMVVVAMIIGIAGYLFWECRFALVNLLLVCAVNIGWPGGNVRAAWTKKNGLKGRFGES